MARFRRSRVASAVALLFPLAAADADQPEVLAQAAAPASNTVPAPPAPASAPVSQQLQRVDIVGTRQRLDAARNTLLPETGSTIYRFSRQDLSNLPLGDSTPINQVILQAPGVVQDSYGQLHIRGDHSNIQYRINGVVRAERFTYEIVGLTDVPGRYWTLWWPARRDSNPRPPA